MGFPYSPTVTHICCREWWLCSGEAGSDWVRPGFGRSLNDVDSLPGWTGGQRGQEQEGTELLSDCSELAVPNTPAVEEPEELAGKGE
ncbi:hypothetical protein AOLI_G00099620 [Acnodon oligacanthus]